MSVAAVAEAAVDADRSRHEPVFFPPTNTRRTAAATAAVTGSATTAVARTTTGPASLRWSAAQRLFLFGPSVEATLSGGSAASNRSASRRGSSGKGSGQRATRHSSSSSSSSLPLFSTSSSSSSSRKRTRPSAVSDTVSARLCSLRASIHELDVEARKLAAARRSMLHSYHQLHGRQSEAELGATDATAVEVAGWWMEAAAAAVGTEVTAALSAIASLSSPAVAALPPVPNPPLSAHCRSAALLRRGRVRHSLRDCHCRLPLAGRSESMDPPHPLLSLASQSLSSPCPSSVPSPTGCCCSLWRLSSAARLPSPPFVPFLSAMYLHNKRASVPVSDQPADTEQSIERSVSAASALPSSRERCPDSSLRAFGCEPLAEASPPLPRASSVAEVGVAHAGSSNCFSEHSSATMPPKCTSPTPHTTVTASPATIPLSHIPRPHTSHNSCTRSTNALAACVAIPLTEGHFPTRLSVDDVDVQPRSADRVYRSCVVVSIPPPTVALLEEGVVVEVEDDTGDERAYGEASERGAMTVTSGPDACSLLPVNRVASLSSLMSHKALFPSPSADPSLPIKRTTSLPVKMTQRQSSDTPNRPPLSPLSLSALNRRQATHQCATLTPQQQQREVQDASRHGNQPAVRCPLRSARTHGQSDAHRHSRTLTVLNGTSSTPALYSLTPASSISTQLPISSPTQPSIPAYSASTQHTVSATSSRLPTSHPSHPSLPVPLLSSATSAPCSPAAGTTGAAASSSGGPSSPSAPSAASSLLVPLSSAQCCLPFSSLHSSVSATFGRESVPLFAGCSVHDLQRWMGELGMKHKSKAQMAAKLTHIYHNYQPAAAQSAQQQRSRQQKHDTPRTQQQQHEQLPIGSAGTAAPSSGSRSYSTTAAPRDDSSSSPSLLSAAMAGRLRSFIRHHSTLYLRVLLLQTIDLQSLHVCCTGAGIAVSREQLVQFLDEEGVAFAQTPNLRHGNRQKRHKT